MARQNYGFEKRQREMKKNKKKEEKRQKKLERGGSTEDAPTGSELDSEMPGSEQAPPTDDPDQESTA